MGRITLDDACNETKHLNGISSQWDLVIQVFVGTVRTVKVAHDFL